jgi:PTH2 family peptidyl-tRNA hydrolase
MNAVDEVTMYIIVRADLKMSKGKIAAQAGHAVQLAIRATERAARDAVRLERLDCDDDLRLKAWEGGSYAKVVLRVDSAEALESLERHLDAGRVVFARVVDEGRTEIPAGTVTALGIQPMPRSRMTSLVGHLRLLT